MTRLLSPMAGWLAPLDEVPDPVFAERMMGDGFAIDPVEGLVAAPCAATVQAIAPTGHSVTLSAAGGATILIHIGLETVALGGAGFEVVARVGAQVAAGDPLIRFSLDRVGRSARSLLTPVILIGAGDRIELSGTGRRVAIGDPLATIHGGGGGDRDRAAAQAGSAERVVTIPMAHGIHARPAARIVDTLRPFSAGMTLAVGERTADARSIVALLSLAAKHGERLTIAATGTDAAGAAEAIAALIAGGMGEADHAPPPRPPAPPVAAAIGSTLAGVTAAPGLAIGTACHLAVAEIAVPADGAGIAAERAALASALAGMRRALAGKATGAAADIAAAHAALLDDPALADAADAAIAAGRSAGHAWRGATRAAAATLRATGDALLIERVADLADIERQVIALLAGSEAAAAPPLPPAAILIAEELLPSQFMLLDMARLAGICTAGGGPTSHVAILAASAGVPMLVAAGPAVTAIPEGRTLVLDADAARLETDPGVALLAETEARLADRRRARADAVAAAHDDARTADGIRIEVFANLGATGDAAAAVAAGGEGCGLLRTEFLFLDRATAPSEDEQARDYAAIAATLGDRPLIVRTLDIGGDKPVAYLPMAAEENPALGLRGVRLTLARPDLLDTQLRAILRGVPLGQCRIMVPMVIEPAELRAVRHALDRARIATGVEVAIPLGVMIETPAAALLADAIAREADFLSIGSNDLTQYALACDRGNPATAARVDALHPAVLRLIAEAAKGAAAHGRWIGVCGGLASDPAAAAILIGLGITELSAAPASIPAVKARVRELRLADCRAIAARALACGDAAEVRALIGETA
ncbi:phosphoenolpyruvate--protein phosphotransferase [Sphingomonas profundi]|uniref:phosphoenolpyruvate--protein phosphotransferase n=1 Tax=Alterirhizorhabdus profundi TaxID=2681549 RepID=UPI0024111EE3|nr:phosphoenolpyruvate--protein phosphotransferase [Sphingomonas profundi]